MHSIAEPRSELGSGPRAAHALVVSAALLALGACVAPLPNSGSGLEQNAYGRATRPSMPPGEPSDEATIQQLSLARVQGRAVNEALRYLEQHEAVASARVRAGDYEITVAFTPRESARPAAIGGSADAHLMVAVQDGYDQRLVPELEVHAELYDESGTRVAAQRLPFVWHPLLNHYGADLRLAAPAAYRVRIWIEPSPLHRHDPVNGDRYRKRVWADFSRLQLDARALARVRFDAARRAILARAQGMALAHALATMAYEVAVDGGMRRAGDYLVAYGVEYAEGFWRWVGGSLRYDISVEESAQKNAHVEVVVLDAISGRFMPGIDVRASLSRDGERIGTFAEPLMWHPWLYHYGRNWRIPSGGKYALDIQVGKPPYACCGRFSRAEHVRFGEVALRAGEK